MEWDSVKLFLDLHRHKSSRAVAAEHSVSASTITRKISRLEKSLDVKLFNRSQGGFSLTENGRELLSIALRMETDAYEIERLLQGKNAVMQGAIRVTMPNHLVLSPLMRYLKGFSDLHPHISIDIHPTWEKLDLNRGEADIALRILYSGAEPPEDLIGSKIGEIYCANYASREYLKQQNLGEPSGAHWIGWNDYLPRPDWVATSAYPHLSVNHHFPEPISQLEAAKAGMGLSMLPCFLGDSAQELVRVPAHLRWKRFDLWMLSHPDLRDAVRFKEFRQYLRERFAQDQDLWTGELKHSASA
jgi:DNA-binding transcriptional LysR family regulator